MKQKILVADDDESIQEILQLMFEDDFDIVMENNGAQTLKEIQKNNFLFVILDIHLPEYSGLDICKFINEMDTEKRPGIVALSGDTSDETVKQAYQLGVSDYIAKPFNVVTFHERIIRFSKDMIATRALHEKEKNTFTLAETAMKQAASYGRAYELVAKLSECHTPQQIMVEVAKNLLKQDLRIAIQLRAEGAVYSYDVDSEVCSEVELQIFDLLKNHGRIYHFGRRSIFNDSNVSILFKNMPFQGSIAYDAILDVAAKLILSINARFLSLMQNESLISAKDQLANAMQLLSKGIQQMEVERKELMESIELKIGLSFHELDMTEDQESFFVNLLETEIYNRRSSSQLSELQNIIKACIDSMVIMDEPPADEPVGSKISDDDVELF